MDQHQPQQAPQAPQDDATPDAGGVTRSQHVVYTMPHDWGVIPQFLAPALERVDRTAGGTQLLIVTPDAETALAVAEAALALRDDADAPLVVPATRTERVTRLARAGAPRAIAGAPDALAALVRASALKLDAVRAVVFAWADAIAATPAATELESVLSELPKEAKRTLVTSEQSDDVDAFIERYMRRPRRVAPEARADAKPITLTYLAVAPTARAAALRRLFDELDPPSATIVTTSDASEAEARRALRALGYRAPTGTPSDDDAQAAFGPDVRVSRGEVPNNVALVVLYDVPTDRAALDRISGARPAQIIALAQPRQLGALRALSGGAVTPIALPDLARAARDRDEAVRGELRAALQAGVPHRELLALEPLLAEFDGTQLAAAALQLLERARAVPRAMPGAASRGADAAPGAMTRLFISVGSKDGVRPGDLVGSIAGEAGITSDRIGKIEVRDAFSLVEVATPDADRVIEKMTGVAIRGRRAMVRRERDRSEGDGGGRGGDRGGDRGERRPPSGDRRPGGRGGERRGPGAGGAGGGGARGPRKFDAQRDGPRGFGAPDDRGVRERAEQRDEWAARAERLRRSRRDSGDTGDAAEGPNASGGAMDGDTEA